MITELQRQQRRGLIGGTTMTAIAGVNPWASPYDAYLELTGQVEDAKENDAMHAGSILERPVLDWLERKEDVKLLRDQFIRDPGGIFCGNLDAVCFDAPEPFIAEAKTTGIVGPRDDAFGEPETEEVPDRVLVQAHQYLRLADVAWPHRPQIRLAIVPVLIGGVGFVKYRIPRNDELVDHLYRMGRDFYANHVVRREPPTGTLPSLEVLKRVKRVPNKIVPVADELVTLYLEAAAAKREAEKHCEKAQSYLLAAMGDAEGGEYSGGVVTYMQINRKGFTVEPTTYRKLTVKANKKGV